MSQNDITNAEYGDMDNTVEDYSVSPKETDGATGDKETEYINTEWSKQLGYYKEIPELRTSIDALARWTVGKGFQADETDTPRLNCIIGFGKDTFNTILENMIRVAKIGGDAFAHIIRNEEGAPINLKPLDPGTVKIIANAKGLIKRYELVSKIRGKGKKVIQPEDMFHISRNRVADEIHGVSLVDAVENIILMRNEAMADMKQLLHRHVKPIVKFMLDTDDETEINEFITKADTATAQGENLYLPMGTVEHEIVSVPTNSTLNPLPWIDRLNNYFFQATGVPQIIVGGSQEMTEATAKIAYLAFEQTINEEQLYIEEAVTAQLGFIIKLEFPATLQNEMLSDKAKSETMQASTQEDTTVQGVPLNNQKGVQ